jgi:hypothetical protein
MVQPLQTAILNHQEESTKYGAALTNSHSQSPGRKHLNGAALTNSDFQSPGKKASNMVEPSD